MGGGSYQGGGVDPFDIFREAFGGGGGGGILMTSLVVALDAAPMVHNKDRISVMI